MNREPYHKFSTELRSLFGCRVQKISLDAGYTCPNRDGTISHAGCIFCDNRAFSPAQGREKNLRIQLEQGMSFTRRRYKARKFIAYFQTFTNTYGPIARLKQDYDLVLEYDEVVGLAISTRPDCLSVQILDLIESYSSKKTVWLELGLQSIHNRTLKKINRGHTFEDFENALTLIADRKIRLCVHVILGLPGETYDDMMLTAETLAGLPLQAVKIHVFHVLQGTLVEHEFRAQKLTLFKLADYVATVTSFLERLPYSMTIQRLAADAPPQYLVAPLWITRKGEIIQAVEREFARRGTYQGFYDPRQEFKRG
ncbi:TIGR01212 family radical SAM protein [candidate division CSSED10-310 bacterium]|uniref:TIGR01212 family radical SAM protein n=1 Tax=candidate division CSSED10-310 bacterium TaxID=2855610 RepID=A0ABV6YU44_UNCC1